MKDRILQIPLDQLHAYEEELPWLSSLSELLMQQGKQVELTLREADGYYHVLREDDHIIVTPMVIPQDSTFFAFRAFQQYMMGRFRTHLEGLAHNLRGPISNIRSRSELMLQFCRTDDTVSENPLMARMAKAFSRFLESSDQMNTQLKDLERLLRWLSPMESVEPMKIKSALETLNACFLTDLFYKRQVKCTINLVPDLPLWTRPANLLIEPVYHMMIHAVSLIQSQQRGELTWNGMMQDGHLQLDLLVHEPSEIAPATQPEIVTSPETRPNGSLELDPNLAFATWVAQQASGSLHIPSNRALPFKLTLQLPVNP